MNVLPAALQRATQSYTDLSALQALKKPSMDKAQQLDAVARQFESLLTAQMLQAMRQANRVLGEGNPFSSYSTEFYEDMFDQQLAVSLSGARGLGLAEVLVRQLSGDLGLSQSPRSVEDYFDAPVRSPLTAEERQVLTQAQNVLDRAFDQTGQTDGMHTGPITAAEPPVRHGEDVLDSRFESPEEFVSKLAPAAKEVAEEMGVDYRVLLAQAALETGWGQHMIRRESGENSFNLFGIKADARWRGDTAWTLTTEYVGGQPIRTRAPFRAYNSWTESFRDYVNFLNSNPRYQPALEQVADPEAYTEALQAAGYATDPAYSQKILRILHRLPQADAPGGES
ncbi:MAG: flagellar assembly peptidoglycan hydrolase FlgJ [Gammaproteobacteria bacterium]|nr:MAG: flagellar assembly peptidoglycan hydrolase FlgJ [Gammaproteobacteria bacterium]